MITAIIVDDEMKSVSTLQKKLVDFCPEVTVIGTAENAQKAKELINEVKPQLVFLDVEMPYGSGFDLLKLFSVIDFEVIFITAFDQYALNAFRFSALDYLLKPVNISQLKEAVNKAQLRIEQKSSVENYKLLLQNLNEKDIGEQKIILTDYRGQHFFKLNDICYCIADGPYTEVHSINAKTFISSKNLKEFEDMLPKELFCRIHHGHIININHIAKILNGKGSIVLMKDGKELEIAVRRKESFLMIIKRLQ